MNGPDGNADNIDALLTADTASLLNCSGAESELAGKRQKIGREFLTLDASIETLKTEVYETQNVDRLIFIGRMMKNVFTVLSASSKWCEHSSAGDCLLHADA
jgi:hypothetical protein